MLEKLATWYLSRMLRKAKINELEIGITSDGWTYHKRNKEKEESIKKTISKIKYAENNSYGGIHTVPPSQSPAPKPPGKQH